MSSSCPKVCAARTIESADWANNHVVCSRFQQLCADRGSSSLAGNCLDNRRDSAARQPSYPEPGIRTFVANDPASMPMAGTFFRDCEQSSTLFTS
jgi:hypothetical protein